MARLWRPGFLVFLLVGPIVAYVGFGVLWLRDQGWLLAAGVIWIGSGILFSILAARWTGTKNHVLPPIDWDRPETFSKADSDAWKMVEQEAERGETVSLEELTEFDVYIDVGRRLAKNLAEHYHPLTDDPIQLVPVVDLLTALELASEDLSQLCRQLPGGDMITPSHWKRAVQVAGYIQRANDIYSYLLPIFSPVTGLARLGSQHLMVKPAWKNMQQNLLRWFFRAYVNRLGTHLIELYSGRLAIGARQYRRLTKRGSHATGPAVDERTTLRIGIAGARGSGKSRLVTMLKTARSGDLSLLKAKLEGEGIDPSTIDALKTAEWFEIPGYTWSIEGESARDRSTRRDAIEEAVTADLLILVSDAVKPTAAADTAFAQGWDRWFIEHPAAELAPAIGVLTGVDRDELAEGSPWRPPYHWEKGQTPRETTVRAKLNALRSQLPPSFTQVVAAGLSETAPFGLVEALLPVLIANFQKAERASLIRHFNAVAGRSKAGRLIQQVGTQGKSLWQSLRAAREARAHRKESASESEASVR